MVNPPSFASISMVAVDSNTLAKDFTSEREIAITMGRGLEPADYRNGSKVCLISQHIADKIIKYLA